jgi:hypothetical protein
MPKKKEDWFTNIEGASEILNRNPRTVGKYVKDGLVDGSTKFGSHKLIPMSDIAKIMGTPESTVVKVAKAKSVPLWKCK